MKLDKYDLYYISNFNNLDELKALEINYDLFISAYNNEVMVHDVYKEINSIKKIWLILPDYNDLNNIPALEEVYRNEEVSIYDNDLESSFIKDFIEKYNIIDYKDKSICIDITGFVKPYMIYLIYALEYIGFKNIDIIYSEPKSYQNQENTEFSEKEIISTRSINGFDMRAEEGQDDLFIINAGYDYRLLINTAGYKKYIKKKTILLGFPSLQPIMYQENILNLQKSADELHIDFNFKPLYAAANDPFDTAKVIKYFVLDYLAKVDNLKTIYLAPLATKSQALGMILFSIVEKDFFSTKGINIKIIYPFTSSYSSFAGEELFKINKYSLEF